MPVHTCPSIKASFVTRIAKRAVAERKTTPKVQSDNAMLAYLCVAFNEEKSGATRSQGEPGATSLLGSS